MRFARHIAHLARSGRVIASTRVLAPVLIFLSAALAACAHAAPPTVIALPNGYYMEKDKSEQPRIVRKSGGVVVKGPISAYAVDRQIVTGRVAPAARSGKSYPNDSPVTETASSEEPANYFVLDTASGKLESGLDAAARAARSEHLHGHQGTAALGGCLGRLR